MRQSLYVVKELTPCWRYIWGPQPHPTGWGTPTLLLTSAYRLWKTGEGEPSADYRIKDRIISLQCPWFLEGIPCELRLLKKKPWKESRLLSLAHSSVWAVRAPCSPSNLKLCSAPQKEWVVIGGREEKKDELKSLCWKCRVHLAHFSPPLSQHGALQWERRQQDTRATFPAYWVSLPASHRGGTKAASTCGRRTQGLVLPAPSHSHPLPSRWEVLVCEFMRGKSEGERVAN